MGMDVFSLKGRTAIVTGASKGLGEAIALSMADAGANLVLTGRDKPSLEKVAEAVTAKGSTCISMVVDVLKKNDILAMTEKTLAEFGKIDILVNNAGVNVVKPLLKITEEEWDRVLDTNLKGYFLCAQAVAPHMIDQKSGCIINNASVFGRTGFMNLSPYIASKGGVVQLTKAMAVEWARFNVRSVCIAPSYIVTEMAKRDIESNPKILEQNIKKIPMRRGGEPREVGNVCVFLASDAASFVTGETIAIDGGWLAW
ncbi:glucose 1-dehydrogenase [uncultured Desulfosarcina sp.]|uniref:SDR family NAD(P)-dependent oxidoreductase n=1 Tax=uncultured Desulfosarcina sp. TaxID=218289 RepID=UPI0029C72C10|nr:glucose 1-dehydrogenase [uncultured Desulfosarcina sp.]